jgi:hypothetical protein
MDWNRVIELNSERLFTVVATLVSMVRVHGGGIAALLPRSGYSAALILLRPAESAVRRLIIIAARGLVVKLKLDGGRGFPTGLKEKLRLLEKDADRIPAFCLIDPLKRFAPEDFEWGKEKAQVIARISVPGLFDPVFPPQPIHNIDDMVAATALGRRVQALRFALDNLPREAKRLARWRAKRELARKAEKWKPGRMSPFRPGFAPGYHRSKPQEVDDILAECHHFAREAWEWNPDTS